MLQWLGGLNSFPSRKFLFSIMPHCPFHSQGSQFGENHRKQECYLLSAVIGTSPTSCIKTNKQTNKTPKPINKTQPINQKQNQRTPKDN